MEQPTHPATAWGFAKPVDTAVDTSSKNQAVTVPQSTFFDSTIQPAPSGAPNGAKRPPRQAKVTRHEVEVSEGAPRLSGYVVSRRDKYGFVKADEADTRYFFHVRDTDSLALQGSHVSFVVAKDLTTGKDVAFDVTTIAQPRFGDGTSGSSRPLEESLPGLFEGAIAILPQAPTSVHIDDGMIVFTDDAGMQQQALFGAWRLATKLSSEGKKDLAVGDMVEFNLAKNAATMVFKAVNVRRSPNSNLSVKKVDSFLDLATAVDGDLPAALAGGGGGTAPGAEVSAARKRRHLGRVTLLKKEFGFIRQAMRPGDLFFHFSQLVGIDPADIHVGDDVEFEVNQDRGTRKLSAQNVTRAAPGSVVFDVIGDEVIRGVIMEKPVGGPKQCSGVLEYENASVLGGKNVRIVFSPADCSPGWASWRPGDVVTFRIATNLAAAAVAAKVTTPGVAQLAGRRAVEVKAVKIAGVVAAVHQDRKFGFIAHDEPPVHRGMQSSEDSLIYADDQSGKVVPSSKGGPTENAILQPGKSEVGSSPAGDNDGAVSGAKDFPRSLPRRTFFHFSEIVNGPLKAGNEVHFVLHKNLKNGEYNASRVRKPKSAATRSTGDDGEAFVGSTTGPAGGPALAATVTERKPNKPKLTGNLQSGELKTTYKPKMPDGTRGFEFSRAKSLAEAAEVVVGDGGASQPYALFAGLALKGLGPAFPRILSVTAMPFVPRVGSAASLGNVP